MTAGSVLFLEVASIAHVAWGSVCWDYSCTRRAYQDDLAGAVCHLAAGVPDFDAEKRQTCVDQRKTRIGAFGISRRQITYKTQQPATGDNAVDLALYTECRISV